MKKIPPFKLVAEPLTAEARDLPKFKWAADDVGTRHRLGGEPGPKFDQRHWPTCADCATKMSFYGQLDSINDEFCIADVGIICVFFCFECNQVKALVETA